VSSAFPLPRFSTPYFGSEVEEGLREFEADENIAL